MANQKVTQLPFARVSNDSDLLYVVQSNTRKKMTSFINRQGGRRQLAAYYNCTQSFITTLSYLLAQKRWVILSILIGRFKSFQHDNLV